MASRLKIRDFASQMTRHSKHGKAPLVLGQVLDSVVNCLFFYQFHSDDLSTRLKYFKACYFFLFFVECGNANSPSDYEGF